MAEDTEAGDIKAEDAKAENTRAGDMKTEGKDERV